MADRHVIKGRGPNRGKYLCWARIAPAEKATEDGFVWLPEQRKATRWADPRYSGKTWATERARVHNGYFVKLVAPAAVTEALVFDLRSFIAGHAAGSEEKLACYWFDGDFHGAGEDFCRDCAEKLVDEKYAADPKRFEELYGECDDDDERYRAAIDGGFDTQHDSPPHCEVCGAKLSGHLTDCGADEEIEALAGDCTPIFGVDSWADLDDAIVNLNDDDPRWRKIAKVVERSRIAEQEMAMREVAFAALPGMSEARSGLLTLLAARQEQKAPEPSFRLWRTLLRYERLSYDRKRAPTRLIRRVELRLEKEAKKFARVLGFDCYYSGGTFIIEAPYGDYYWRFIVEIEQWRLWQPAPFNEGRTSGQRPRKPYRDGNPYDTRGGDYKAPMSIEARQWDAGYMFGVHEGKMNN